MVKYKIVKQQNHYYPMYESSHGWAYFQATDRLETRYMMDVGPDQYLCFKSKDMAIEYMENHLEKKHYSVTVWQAEGL